MKNRAAIAGMIMFASISAMDRSAAGESGFSREFPAATVAPTAASGSLDLRLLVDACSIEAFGPDFALTNLVFPSAPYNLLSSSGSLSFTVYPLNP